MNSQSGEAESENEAEKREATPSAIQGDKTKVGAQPARAQGQQTSGRSAYWEKRQYWVQATIAVVGAVSVVIYACQLHEMQNATRAATDSLDLTRRSLTQSEESRRFDQRAWVAAMSFGGTAELGQPFITKVRITNTGKTFARDTEIHFRADIVGKDQPPPLGLLAFGLEGTERSVVLLPPNGNSDAVYKLWNGEKLTQTQIDSLITEEQVVFVFGKITYSDVFGCKHWATYCARYNALDKAYVIYEKHNEAGDEPCP